jgi:hypothetical protein
MSAMDESMARFKEMATRLEAQQKAEAEREAEPEPFPWPLANW